MFESNKRLSEIAEISLLTNRWCMWADSSLPGHETYVPAVFQTRDAFYHFIDLVATGIGTKDTPGALQSNKPEAIGEFWINNPETMAQLNEILHHISRGFFDVVDHICIQLVRQKKKAGSSDCYMWYDRQLVSYSVSAQRLREEKSRTPEKTVQTVRKWDILLQHITSAYMMADQHARSEDALVSIHKLFKRIEATHSLETIEKACKDYLNLKTQFEHIVSGTEILSKIVALGKKVSNIIAEESSCVDEAFIKECENLKLDVEKECEENYDQLANIYQRLDDVNHALFSTTRVQKVRKRTESFSQGIKTIAQMVIAAIPTYLIEKYLFQQNADSIVPTLKQMLNDNAVSFLIRYLIVLVGVHFAFKLISWVWWHISADWHFRQLRKKVRKALPKWLEQKKQEEAEKNS